MLAGLGDAAERSPGPLLEEMANGLDEESGLIRMNGFHGDLVGFDEGGIGMGSPEDGQAGEQGYGDSANERMLEERSPVDLRRVKVRLVLFFFLPFLFPIFYRVVVASWEFQHTCACVHVLVHQPNSVILRASHGHYHSSTWRSMLCHHCLFSFASLSCS